MGNILNYAQSDNLDKSLLEQIKSSNKVLIIVIQEN